MDAEELVKALPKAEQHVHIVGSIKPRTLLWLIEEGNLGKPFESVEDVRRFFRYRDFPHFISVYGTLVDSITTEDQFERITYEMLEDDARCNVRYVEASFSAPDHVRKGLDYGQILDAINRGVSRAHLDFGIECNVRIDLVRNYGPQAGMEVLDWIESKSDNIVSIDLGGSEERFPAKPFAPVYRRAKKMGLHLVAHAGEAVGAESIWEAVRDLDVEHIGHGLSATTDPKLMDYLVTRNITVETCPTSNVRIGMIPSLERHPVKTFLEDGLNVTVSTDDPAMFDTNMNNEYLQLHYGLNFALSELFKLSLNAVDSSFRPEEKRIKMREAFLKEYQRLLDRDFES
jgi:aminodeoxyfutalosine deaminase